MIGLSRGLVEDLGNEEIRQASAEEFDQQSEIAVRDASHSLWQAIVLGKNQLFSNDFENLPVNGRSNQIRFDPFCSRNQMTPASVSSLRLAQSQLFLSYRIPQQEKWSDRTAELSPDDEPVITETTGYNGIVNWVRMRMFPSAFAPVIGISDRSSPTITQRTVLGCTSWNKCISYGRNFVSYKGQCHPHLEEVRDRDEKPRLLEEAQITGS
jgi:hypothetical protein